MSVNIQCGADLAKPFYRPDLELGSERSTPPRGNAHTALVDEDGHDALAAGELQQLGNFFAAS
jgi:hypothetical protein